MSCYWDVYCLDCNSGMGLNLNRDPGACQEVIEFKDAIALLDGFSPGYGWGFVVAGESGRVDPTWMKLHRWHTLRPMSESGDFYGDCHAWDDKPEHGYCRLAASHEGEHNFFPQIPPWADGFGTMLSVGKLNMPSGAARLAMRLKNFSVGVWQAGEELEVKGNLVLAGHREGRHVVAREMPGSTSANVFSLSFHGGHGDDGGLVGIAATAEKMLKFLRPEELVVVTAQGGT